MCIRVLCMSSSIFCLVTARTTYYPVLHVYVHAGVAPLGCDQGVYFWCCCIEGFLSAPHAGLVMVKLADHASTATLKKNKKKQGMHYVLSGDIYTTCISYTGENCATAPVQRYAKYQRFKMYSSAVAGRQTDAETHHGPLSFFYCSTKHIKLPSCCGSQQKRTLLSCPHDDNPYIRVSCTYNI